MSNKTKGILLIILSAFAFSTMSFLVKFVDVVPAMQKAFFRNIVSLTIATILMIKAFNKENEVKTFETFKNFFTPKNKKFILLRVTFGTMGLILTYLSIDALILSDATVLLKLSPFFTVIFSYLILKEKVSKHQIVSIIVAFIGALFIIKPTFDVVPVPYLLAVSASVCAGMAYTSLRVLGTKGENGKLVIFYFSLTSSIALLPIIIFNYTPMTLNNTLIIVCAATFATIGQFCITKAYSLAPAKDITIYDYTQVVFSSIYSVMFFSAVPDMYSIIGYIIVILASFYMAFGAKFKF